MKIYKLNTEYSNDYIIRIVITFKEYEEWKTPMDHRFFRENYQADTHDSDASFRIL